MARCEGGAGNAIADETLNGVHIDTGAAAGNGRVTLGKKLSSVLATAQQGRYNSLVEIQLTTDACPVAPERGPPIRGAAARMRSDCRDGDVEGLRRLSAQRV